MEISAIRGEVRRFMANAIKNFHVFLEYFLKAEVAVQGGEGWRAGFCSFWEDETKLLITFNSKDISIWWGAKWKTWGEN